MTKNTENSHSDVTIIYHLRRRPLLPIRWKNAPGVNRPRKRLRKPSKTLDKMKKICIMLLIGAVAMGMTSCKAWRTINTTSTYTQVGDSSKVTTTISTKTVEEYQGVKK